MLALKTSTLYRKDYKRIVRRGLNTDLLKSVIQQLREQKPLDPKHSS
jgi:mRNA interferase YafQ